MFCTCWVVIGGMLQCRQLSEILSEDGKWEWTAHIAIESHMQ